MDHIHFNTYVSILTCGVLLHKENFSVSKVVSKIIGCIIISTGISSGEILFVLYGRHNVILLHMHYL